MIINPIVIKYNYATLTVSPGFYMVIYYHWIIRYNLELSCKFLGSCINHSISFCTGSTEETFWIGIICILMSKNAIKNQKPVVGFQ